MNLPKTAIESQRVRELAWQASELAKIKKAHGANAFAYGQGPNSVRSDVRKVIERNTLTPEDLESGAWREIKLRPYDVKLAARTSTRPRFTRCARSSSKPAARFWRWASPKSSRR